MSLIPTRDEVPRIVRHTGVRSTPTGSVGSAPGSSGGNFTPRDILRILRQRIWLILLSLVIFTSAAVAGTFFWLQTAPYYTATAVLVVNPPKATEMNATNPYLATNIMDRLIQSRAVATLSPDVFNRAMPEIRKTGWFERVTQKNEDVNLELMDDLSVVPERNTHFFKISMTARDPHDAATIANAISRAAIADVSDITKGERADTIQRLTESVETLKSERDKAVQTIKNLQNRGIGGQGKNIEAVEILRLRTMELVRQISKIRGDYVAAAQAIEVMNSQTDEELAETPEIQFQIQGNPVVGQFEQQVAFIEFELMAARKKYGDGHNVVRNLKRRLEAAEKKLQAQKEKVAKEAIVNLRAARQSQFLSLADQYEKIKAQLDTTNANLKTLEQLNTQLAVSQETKETSEKRIAVLETRLLDLQLLRRGEKPIALQQAASLPKEPSSPRFIINVPLGVFLGLAVGVGLAFLLEFLDTSIKAPSDISRRVDLPLLGMVPHLDDVEEDLQDLRVGFLENPHTIFSEAFRQIRTNLLFSGPIEQHRTILLTSPMPEDGRTATALNLAHSIARGGKKVLVVDANFRQPAIRSLFPTCPGDGLSTSLVGQADWRELVHEVEPNFHVMATGPMPPNPAELLGSETMKHRLEQFQDDYDQILIDCAPCLVVSDATVLAGMVDGTILIVRAGVNTYGIVQRSRDILQRVGVRIMGVVLNGVRVTAGGYLRKNYETFYQYREGLGQGERADV